MGLSWTTHQLIQRGILLPPDILHTQTHRHTHTNTYGHTPTHTHTHTHLYTHAQAHTYAHIHTHAHTGQCACACIGPLISVYIYNIGRIRVCFYILYNLGSTRYNCTCIGLVAHIGLQMYSLR